MTEHVHAADVVAQLRDAVHLAGGQKQYAKAAGISPQFLCDVLNGRADMTDRVLAPLGLRRVTVFVRVAK